MKGIVLHWCLHIHLHCICIRVGLHLLSTRIGGRASLIPALLRCLASDFRIVFLFSFLFFQTIMNQDRRIIRRDLKHFHNHLRDLHGRAFSD